ncbi:MAG: ROK family protein [Candidatus Korarchaeota archaeon]|nr:ROK family protein [Candidatus Korarchaeota archaeon]NIU84242.1 ROK family protein [Candidatus Thorarchaeota archaeon]NIW14405.1 ROK family protein [Candidatus Thorarchaeota archaeon]NIW52474.1 ROK family protein [Candidatus Korarchaeota archaeon]
MSDEQYALGVDIGASNVRLCIGTREGEILKKVSQSTPKKGTSGKVVTEQIISLVKSIQSDFSSSLVGIGIGSIGPLDIQQGIVHKPPNLPYRKISLKDPLKKAVNLPVFILNDCVTAVIGEKHFGAGKERENLAFVTLSSGIGGGIIVDGHVLVGKEGNATEIGHVVVDPEGRLTCGCGKRGHWEAYCGGENIPNYVELLIENGRISPRTLLSGKVHERKLSSELIYRLAKAGNKEALKITEDIGKINAIGFADLINCFAPSLITVGGAIALSNPELVLTPIKRYLENYTINPVPSIELTPLKEDVVLYGALWMAFNRFPEKT